MSFSAITFVHVATEPGALSGHGFRCSCGEVQTTSLSMREAMSMARKHIAWHEAQQADDEYFVEQCECELDWRCPIHAGLPTPIELINDRYASVQSDIDCMHGAF